MLVSYLVGAGAAAVGFIPVGFGSAAVRARRLPTWSGAPARLAEIVVGLAVVVGVSQVLGTLGMFHLLPVTLGLAAVGATLCWFERRPMSSRGLSSNEPSSFGTRHRSGEALVVLVAVAVVVAAWTVRTSDALAHGMVELESLRYHLPKAARFVQLGSLTSIHHIDVSAGGSLIPYYPDTSALLHALGILFVGSDLLSPLLNVGFLALALLGGWCVGRPYGAAPVSMLGALLVLGTPQLVSGQPGTAANDVIGIALVLAAVALLVTADSISGARAFAPLCVAALACGLALGVKYTFIAVVGALLVGMVIVSPEGTRLRRTSWLAVLVLATGGYWFVRNLVVVGNPLPAVELHLGPLTLPSVPSPIESFSLTSYLFDGSAVTTWLYSGLRATLGPAWWALLALAVAGLILGIATGRSAIQRMVASAGAVALAVYVVLPQPISPGLGAVGSFQWNVRYGFHGLIVGLVLLPVVPAMSGRRARTLVLSAYALVLAATQLDATIWPTGLLELRYVDPVRGTAVVAGLAVGIFVLVGGGLLLVGRSRLPVVRQPHRAVVLGGGAIVVAAILAGGLVLQDYYLDHPDRGNPRLDAVEAWAADTSDARIADAGNPWQYPLYGRDLSNYVEYIGRVGPAGELLEIDDCTAWKAAMSAGRFTHLAIWPPIPPLGTTAPVQSWAESDPAFELVTNANGASVFRVTGALDPAACPPPL